MSPKVSVLMSVYNGLPYLHESIESILNQTYTDFEFVIIDDCSTDKSWSILEKYATQDSRIKLYQNEHNLGLTKSLNKGLKLAQGEYIARQDADDISLPERLQKQVYCLSEESDVILVSSEWESIDNQDHVLGNSQRAIEPILVTWYLHFVNYIGGHSQVVYRRKSVLSVGCYCESYPYAQDYELWLRLSKKGKIVILPDILLKYRVHDESISSKSKETQRKLALLTAKNELSNLISEDITLSEVTDIVSFIQFPDYWDDFLKNCKDNYYKANILNKKIEIIYKKFLDNYAEKLGGSYQEDSTLLKKTIAYKFLCWSKSVSIKKNPLNIAAKIKILLYSLRWNPLTILDYWRA